MSKVVTASTPDYPLDQTEITVNIVAAGQTLSHKLARPTLDQLLTRESRTSIQSQSISETEEVIKDAGDDEAANAKLWDEIAIEVKGYRMASEPAEIVNQWKSVAELKNYIPISHKSGAIRAMYQSAVSVIRDPEEFGFTLGAQEWKISQTFGDPDLPSFVITYVLRTPTEGERRDFRRKATEVRFGKGTRNQTTKVLTKLRAYVEMYDLLFVSIDGATVDDHPYQSEGQRGPFLEMIDPMFKRQVVDCLMKEFDARVRD